MEEARDYSKVKDFLNENDRFCAFNSMRLTTVREDYAEAVMPVTKDNINGVGVVQGGAIFTLADFSFAGAVNANPDSKVSVAMNASINFIRPGTGSKLKAVCRIINRGRQTCIGDIEVFNDSGKLVAKLTITGFLFQKK